MLLKFYPPTAAVPEQCRWRYDVPAVQMRILGSAVRCSAVSLTAVTGLNLKGLEEDGISYKEQFKVRCYEVGSNRTATVETIANLLQEAGCNHVRNLGFSTDGFATTMTMRKLRLIWVTSQMHIQMNKYPAWGDVVEIETWCEEEGRIGTRRDWVLKDQATGSLIGRATSKFVMMNQDTRKLQRVSDQVREECLVFRSGNSRFVFQEEERSSMKKIPRLQDPEPHAQLKLVPRRADLDMNQHVNHVSYIGWALESIPQEIIDTHELQAITLEYKRECQYDDVVDSLSCMEVEKGDEKLQHPANGTNGSATGKQNGKLAQCEFLHFLRLSSNGQEITRGRTYWRKLLP